VTNAMDNDYSVQISDYIIDNQAELESDALLSLGEFDVRRPAIRRKLVVSYRNGFTPAYNAFTLFKDSPVWQGLLSELCTRILEFYKSQDIADVDRTSTLFLKAWVNLASPENVLGWHKHAGLFHGYLAITPQDTMTQFSGEHRQFLVENKVGTVYFGPAGLAHRVLVTQTFGKFRRLTIGFDVLDTLAHTTYPTNLYIPIPVAG
jgi:hypothetical protein